MKKWPGEEISICLKDINYPDIELKYCIARRFNNPFEREYRSCIYHIIGYIDRIIELNKREDKLREYYDRS